jgi:hypothetical protein
VFAVPASAALRQTDALKIESACQSLHNNKIDTIAFKKPAFSIEHIPKINPPKPMVESTIDRMSIFGFVKVERFF